MTRQIVDLGPAAGIAYLDDLFAKVEARRDEGAAVPGIEEIRADLRAAGERGAIPARVDRGKSRDHYLWLYIDARYALNLDPTDNGRGYLIRDVRLLRLRDIDQIVRTGFALHAASWDVYDHPGELPDGLWACWDQVTSAWRARRQAEDGDAEPAELPVRHAGFLDKLESLVEKAREIEMSGTKTDRVFRYRGIEPVAAERRNARSIHKFQLMGESEVAELAVGARVFVEGRPDMRGEVRDIAESLVRIHFERPLHFDDIHKMGSFVASPDTTTFDKQAEAISILREGRSRNPHLLDAIVDRSFQPYQPAGMVGPKEQLDVSQRQAFKMALTVPDLALIQGPPGTGKTRTIRQVIHQCSVTGARILVSAYTNQAVDNVLKDLPETLTVIRVGNGVTDECAHLTLDKQALRLQRRILDRIGPVLKQYAEVDLETGEVVQRLRQLTHEHARLTEAAEHVRALSSQLDTLDAKATAAARENVERLAADEAEREAAARECDQVVADISARRAVAAKAAEAPLIGRFARGRQDRLAAELARVAVAADQAHRAAEQARAKRTGAESALTRIRASHPALVGMRASLDAARAKCGDQADRAAAAARLLCGCLPNPEALPDVQSVPVVLDQFQAAAEEAVAIAQRRLRLLTEWRGQLGRKSEQLNRELIRYADVIGATCIGTASNQELADVDFKLAIIDEAGQINTPSLLVPLVRAHRAILVGDHVQLPPYCERALADWARSDGDGLADLATKSAFELLYPHVPRTNKRMLKYQLRMPEVVAEFISTRFYHGDLKSKVKRPLRDDLFAATMAFIDTGELKDRERRERRPRADEPWPKSSFVNDAEAEIIADLAAYYHAQHEDWVVIVPFSAQKGRVIDLLAKRLGDEELAASRVASVDSFQGGERDTVIFGFTRSNANGDIGFLYDVRRSNVAFSRAKYRLIIVGDQEMLCQAHDRGFAEMAEALREHVRSQGDLRGYREMRARLAAEADQ